MRQRLTLLLLLGLVAVPAHAATGQRRRAVAPPAPVPSSAALIDQALAKGTITPDQAVTYKVFADFGDSRLPGQFHGDDSDMTEASSPALAAAQWSTLSQTARDQIGPYLVPPFYQGSWWDQQRVGAASVQPSGTCRPWDSVSNGCPTLNDWTYQTGAHLRVWYEASKANADLDAIVADLNNETDTRIWPELNRIMGTTPILEHDIDGKTLLDVVLVNQNSADVIATTYSTHFFSCGRADATFIVMNSGHPQFKLIRDYRVSILAHELLHAVQHTYNTKDCLEPPMGDGYKWLMESTATWFEDELYPTTDREHKFVKYYIPSTDLSIDDQKAPSHVGRNYGAYLFFFFLTRIAGGDPTTVVRDVWKATETGDAIHALKDGLSAAGMPLDTYWSQFAVYTWNAAPPYDKYRSIDTLTNQADIEDTTSMSLPSGDTNQALTGDGLSLPHLSMRYYQFDFPDATVSSVVFYNGIGRALNVKPASIPKLGNILTAAPLTDPSTARGAHVDALLLIDRKWTHEDWTGKPFKAYCRDMKAERIDSLIIILSNSDITTTLTPRGKYPPIVQATNIGCYAWVANADLKWNDKSGRIETMKVSDLRLEALGDVPDDDFTPLKRMFTAVSGTYSWTASGVSGACGYSGSFTGNISNPADFLYTFPYAKTPAAGARGILPGLAQEWLPPRNVQENCVSQINQVPWKAGQFFFVALPTDSFARFSSDGQSISVDAHKINSDVTGTWTLVAKKQ